MSELIQDTQLERDLLSRIIEARRLKLRLTQMELAEAAGITQSMLSRIELGGTKVSAFTLYNLCKALHLDIRRVFSRIRNSVNRQRRGV